MDHHSLSYLLAGNKKFVRGTNYSGHFHAFPKGKDVSDADSVPPAERSVLDSSEIEQAKELITFHLR